MSLFCWEFNGIHKYQYIIMIISKGVTTNPDECKDVGLEIGTSSKRETILESVEEIV